MSTLATDPAAIREAAARGAALLDARWPAWWERVTDELLMSTCTRCVIGQVYGIEPNMTLGYDGDYEPNEAFRAIILDLGLTLEDQGGYGGTAADHGFTIRGQRDWDMLTAAWRDEIKARQVAP